MLPFTVLCAHLVLIISVNSATISLETVGDTTEDGITEEGSGNNTEILAANIAAHLKLEAEQKQELLNRSRFENDILNQLDLDTWEAPYAMRKAYPYYLAGYSEDNLPIWGLELGHWDLKKIMVTGGQTLKDFEKYVEQFIFRILENLKAQSTPEEPIKDVIFLVDFDGLQLEQIAHLPSITWLLKLTQTYRELLEAHLGGAVIVNANFVAENLINLLRPVLGRILEKFEVYGTRRSTWLRHTKRKFGNQVPEYYGGPADFTPVKVFG